MSTESDIWKKLRDGFRRFDPESDFCRHEDKFRSGIPDVSYGLWGVNGWIELKCYKNWPKDSSSYIPFRNFKQEQRRFLKRRGKAGGHCFLLVKIGRDFLLFDWRGAQRLGRLNRGGMFRVAIWTGPALEPEELAELLTN